MPIFDGPNLLITLDDPTGGVLNISVEIDLYSLWKEWVIGRYFFDTETDVNGTTERITFIDHSLYTGQAVVYFNDDGAENIGLVDGREYFVRADFDPGPAYDKDEFELYDTKANAEAAEPDKTGRLDLTASGGGSGETHRIAADNSKFLAAFRTIGGDELTPGVEAGPYFFLQNDDGWRIISTDADQTINYQGNLVGESATTPLINVTTGRSVLHLGLQPVTQRVDELLELSQVAEYNGAVSIDTINGVPGIAYPVGTPQSPVSNLPDALVIAGNLSFEQFILRGAITLTSAFTGFSLTGIGVTDADTVVFAGQDVSGTVFRRVSVSGSIATLTSPVDFEFCHVGHDGFITDYQGTMTSCVLENDIALAPGQTNIINCHSAAPGVQFVLFDFQATNQIDLFVRGFVGVFQIGNSTNAASLTGIDLLSGITIINSDWAAGTINIRGVGSYINNSAIAVNDKGLIDSEDVLIIKQMVAGNATISLDDLTVTVFDEDDVTILAVFSVSADGRVRTRTT